MSGKAEQPRASILQSLLRVPLLPILLVLLLAAAMRIVGAAHNPIWSDEAWNMWATAGGFAEMFERLAANHHPPAYFLALDLWPALAGESRLALRFLSIAAGMLAVAVVYRTGKDHFGTAAGISAALVFAVFEQPVYYGQSVRHYAWLLLAEALALWTFLRVLRRPTWARLAAYMAAVAFVAYSVYIGLIAVAAQAGVGLLVWRAPSRIKARLLLAYAGALALFAPWLIAALPGALRKIEAGAITGYINSIPTTTDGLLKMIDILLGGQAALGLGLIALAVSSRFLSAEKNSERRSEQQAFIAVLACSVGALAAMALLNLRVGVVSERTLAFMTPAFALALGAGAAGLPPRARNALIGALAVWAILTPQHSIPRLNSDRAAETVGAGYSAGDLIVLETGFDDIAFAYEMESRLPELDRRVFPTFYEYDYPDDPAMLAALDAEIAGSDRAWLVYWNVPQRLHERLRDAGFIRTERKRIPVGVDDPLYLIYPEIEISRYVRLEPEAAPRRFGDALTLLEAITPERVPIGGAFSVDLIWQAEAPLPLDYTTALFVLDDGGATRLESFGPDAANPATQWPTEVPVIDTHRFRLPPELAPGRYTLYAVVYWYQTVDTPLTVGGERGAVVGEIVVE